MVDPELLLDLRCPRRTLAFFLSGACLLLAPLAAGLYLNWYQDWSQKALAGSLALLFGAVPAEVAQARLQVSRTGIRTRQLGFWRQRALPERVEFKSQPDLDGAAAMARGWLQAPPSILIMDASTNWMVGHVGYEMLAGMNDAEYERLLLELNRKATHA